MRGLEWNALVEDMRLNLVNYSAGDTMIRIFVTGGTFDKDYNELTGSLVFKDTHLPEMLRLGRSRVEVSIRTLMMIDSLEMTDRRSRAARRAGAARRPRRGS